MFVDLEFVPVVAVQPLTGSNPDEALVVLGDIVDAGIREPILSI